MVLNMKIASINTPNAFSFNRTTELRFSEPGSEDPVSAALLGTDKAASLDIELGQTTDENAEKGIAAEKPDNLQADDMLLKAINEANKKLAQMSVEFQFNYHEKTGRVNIKIIDSDTKDVIREIPSMETLDALAKLMELAGIIVDEKK